MKGNILHILIFLSFLIEYCFQKEKFFFKCGKNNLTTKPIKSKHRVPKDSTNIKYKRQLDADGFKEFNIYLDLTNIEKGITIYKLEKYRNMFISTFNKVINTLSKLLRIKPSEYDYYIPDSTIEEMEIDFWDKSKFGDSAKNKGITMGSLNIDLLIFGRFASIEELGDEVLASAAAFSLDEETSRPILGFVNINKDLDYSIEHSQEYFESIILHEFTHILGFDEFLFKYYYNNLLTKKDKFGITRYYINSPKVINVAKKYFNCQNIKGVELENSGGEGTAGSHWEARILLGDYMNGVIYTEEQVISEFTLALLEDTGCYKANYYTGGLMRYGKNKGCDFLYEKCVNNYEINPNFGNEFFDWFSQYSYSEPSCSSGRQSRAYNLLWSYYKIIPNNFQYYNSSYLGGSSAADYCPVSSSNSKEGNYAYYIGHCSEKGNGEYGYEIPYYNEEENITYYYTSRELEPITGEKYSETSFCYLSSLIKKDKSDYQNYSQRYRALCYETFCSSKSLTIKINDDYFVCPRQGGKIKVKDYEGYFLCPDYNLMCSGTVLCNNMFDCVNKESLIREEGYNYDYEIKTTQNIERVENEEIKEKNNYELAQDGECPQYCKLCTKNYKCLECKDNSTFVGKEGEETIKCVENDKLNIGYYKKDNFYYECIENCDICNNGISCESCNSNYLYFYNKCLLKIEHCKEYNENGECNVCDENYAFVEDKRKECIDKESLTEYYSVNNGISYIKCSGENENNINFCKKCHFNETLICDECYSSYYLNGNNACIKKSNALILKCPFFYLIILIISFY